MSPSPHPTVRVEFLDANPILRYLLADHAEHNMRSAALIESDRRFRISVVTLAEVGHVLTRVAKVNRQDAVDAMIALLERGNIEAHEIQTDLAIEALTLCRHSGRVNFGDAMLWAAAKQTVPARVWTFDEQFPSDQIEFSEP